MIYLSFFLTMVLFIYGLLSVRDEKKGHVQSRLAKVTGSSEAIVGEPDDEKEDLPISKRIIGPLWKSVRRNFRKKMKPESDQKENNLELKLLKAGNPFGMTPVEYRLIQIILMVLLPVLFGGYSALLGGSFGADITMGLFGAGIALIFPKIYINQKIKARNEKALKELPDVLDLLTVSLEAGLGFDSALGKLVSKQEGVLSDEFHRCLEEIRLGRTRREALTGVKERLELDEIKVLISNILQAEKLGIGMVQVLRVQSNEVRDQRKQRAEEQAMKAPVKMMFPLVLFIFPSLFIVLLGPALINFLDAF
ncbi:type II secretion system F family protein [Pontibacillus marinus]|uniref:type II secretion system F family protein n=2 Tax=Pontibacillus marinus TaxID=273164 RepID=UPI000428B924|nr:type II secretion system F family protein [Pontibacillus marinus]